MGASKANTMGIVKNILPRVQHVRPCNSSESAQDYFFPQNGKDNKPNHPLLFELPYLRTKTQSQQGKKWYKGSRYSAVLTYQADIWDYPPKPPRPPPPPSPILHVSRGKQTEHGFERRMPGYFEFRYMKWFISFFWWHVTGSFMSFIKKRFLLVTWLIKVERHACWTQENNLSL